MLRNEKDKSRKGLSLVISKRLISVFSPLLQHGFSVITTEGTNIKEFLCYHLGFSPEYLNERIQSILLNGKPVDNPDRATLEDGSTLALSASMPGLVGATLRRESILASFRSTITHKEKNKTKDGRPARVTLKLFNLVMKESGPHLLKQGIIVEKDELIGLLKNQPSSFWEGCKEIYLNGENIIPDELLEKIESEGEWIFLQVISPEES